MKRSRRIGIVESVAEREERDQRRLMAKSQHELDAALTRLEELMAYRQEYATGERPRSGASALQWKDYHSFMQRLEQAVTTQEQIVADGRRQRELHQQHWMAKRRRLKSISRVVDRYQKQEADEEQRRQQRLQDELASSSGHRFQD